MAHLVRVAVLVCAAAAPAGSGYLAPAGRFWHITDLHLDPSYHLSPDPTKVCYSSKGAPAAHAGPFGDFLCDSPYALIQSAFAHMAPLTRPRDFIIWTGDSPPHVPADELSTDAVVRLMGNMTQTIRQHFPNLTVFPALGNHDYWPQVYVIAHVPVGYLPYARDTPALRERHNERLVAIFRAHSGVIAGHFYGHTHRDSVMVLLDQQGKPLTSLFVAPAVTPIKHVEEPYSNNPALRAYVYDPEDFALLDVWQYFLNLTEANEKQRADWRLEYIMTEAFGLRDLRPPRLLQLGLSFLPPPAAAFRRYFAHFMVSYDGGVVCEGECKLLQVCAVLHLDRRGYSRCVAGGG